MERHLEELTWSPSAYAWDPHRLVAVPNEPKEPASLLHQSAAAAGTQPESLVAPVLGSAAAGSVNQSFSAKCKVEGCMRLLQDEKPYYQRFMVCEEHMRSSAITVDGVVCRFCQQCARFEPVEAFDGSKRSCRARLQEHNKRRRKAGTNRVLRRQRRSASASKAGSAEQAAASITDGLSHQNSSGTQATGPAVATQSASRSSGPAVDMALEIASIDNQWQSMSSQRVEGPDSVCKQQAHATLHLRSPRSNSHHPDKTGCVLSSAAPVLTVTPAPPSSGELQSVQKQHQLPVQGGAGCGPIQQQQQGSVHGDAAMLHGAKPDAVIDPWRVSSQKQTQPLQPHKQVQQAPQIFAGALDTDSALFQRFLGSCDSVCAPAVEAPPAALSLHASCMTPSADSAIAVPAAAPACHHGTASVMQCSNTSHLSRMVSPRTGLDSMAAAGRAYHPLPQQQLQAKQLAPQGSACTSCISQHQPQQTQKTDWLMTDAEILLDQLLAESQQPLHDSQINSRRSGTCNWCNHDRCCCNSIAGTLGSLGPTMAQQPALKQPQEPPSVLPNTSNAMPSAMQSMQQGNAYRPADSSWVVGSNAASQQQGVYSGDMHNAISMCSALPATARAEGTADAELLKQHSPNAALSCSGQQRQFHSRQMQYQQQLEQQQQQLSALQRFEYQGRESADPMGSPLEMGTMNDMEEELLIDQQIQEYMQRAQMQATLSASGQEVAATAANPCGSVTAYAGRDVGITHQVRSTDYSGGTEGWFATTPAAAAGAAAGASWYLQPDVQGYPLSSQGAHLQQSQQFGSVLSGHALQAQQQQQQWQNSVPQCRQGASTSAQTSGMQQQQQHPFEAALQIAQGGASAATYGPSVDSSVRLGVKIQNIAPHQLNHDMVSSLNAMLSDVGGVVETGYMRPGCLHLLLQIRVPGAAHGAPHHPVPQQVSAAHQQGNGDNSSNVYSDAAAAVSTALAGVSSTAWARALLHSSSVDSSTSRHGDEAQEGDGSPQPLSLTVQLPDGRALAVAPEPQVVSVTRSGIESTTGAAVQSWDQSYRQPGQPLLQQVVPCVVSSLASPAIVMAVGSGLHTPGCAVLSRMQGMFLPATAAPSPYILPRRTAGSSSDHMRVEVARLQRDGLLYIEFQQGVLLSECKPVLVVQDVAVLAELKELNLQVAAGGHKQLAAERLLTDFGRLLDFRAVSERHQGGETPEQQDQHAEGGASAAVQGPGVLIEDSAYEEGFFHRDGHEADSRQGSPLTAASDGTAMSSAATDRTISASSYSVGSAANSDTAVASASATEVLARHAAGTSGLTAPGSTKRHISFLDQTEPAGNRVARITSGGESSTTSIGLSAATRRLRQNLGRLVDRTRSFSWSQRSTAGCNRETEASASTARSQDMSGSHSRALSQATHSAAAGRSSVVFRSCFMTRTASTQASSVGNRTAVTVQQMDTVGGHVLQHQQEGLSQLMAAESDRAVTGSSLGEYSDMAADADLLQESYFCDEDQEGLMHPMLDVEYKAWMMDIGVRLLQYFLDKGCPACCKLVLEILLIHAAPVASFPAIAAAVRADDQLSILHRAVRSGSVAMLIMVLHWGVQQRYKLPWDSPGPLGLTPLHLAALNGKGARIAVAILKSSPAVASLWFHVTARDGCTPAAYASKLGLNGLNRFAWSMLHGAQPLQASGVHTQQSEQRIEERPSGAQPSSQQRQQEQSLTDHGSLADADASAVAEMLIEEDRLVDVGFYEGWLQLQTVDRSLTPVLEHSASSCSIASVSSLSKCSDTCSSDRNGPSSEQGAAHQDSSATSRSDATLLSAKLTTPAPSDEYFDADEEDKAGSAAVGPYSHPPVSSQHFKASSVSSMSRRILDLRRSIADFGASAREEQEHEQQQHPRRQLKKKDSISDSADSYDAVLLHSACYGKGLLGSETPSPSNSFARRSASELHQSSSASDSQAGRLAVACARGLTHLESLLSESPRFKQGLRTMMAAIQLPLMLLLVIAVLRASGWCLATSAVGLLVLSSVRQLVHALPQRGTRSALLDADGLQEWLQVLVNFAVSPIRVQHNRLTLVFADTALEKRYTKALAQAHMTSDVTVCALAKALVLLVPLFLRMYSSAAAAYFPAALMASRDRWLLPLAYQVTGAAAGGIPLAAALLLPGGYHKLRDLVLAGFQVLLLFTLKQPLLLATTAETATHHGLFFSTTAVLLLVVLRQRFSWVLLQAAWGVGACLMLMKAVSGPQASASGTGGVAWTVPEDCGTCILMLMAAVALCYMRERTDRNMFLRSCANSKLQKVNKA